MTAFAGPNAMLSGIVTDASGAPMSGVRVDLLGAAAARREETSEDGRFVISGLSAGSYVLIASKAQFAEKRIALRLAADEQRELTITLSLGPLSSEVTVTGEAAEAEPVEAIAQRTNVLPRDVIESRVATTVTEALQEEAGVAIQRTAPVMGGVFVRGLTGKNVAVYRDGVRYTTSAQRGGVSTFFNLQEAAGLDAIEVLRGPNSTQFGSDSLGGTVHFLSKSATVGGNGKLRGELAPLFSSPSMTFGGHTLLEYSGSRFGMVAVLASRRINTLRAGQGEDSRSALIRFLGIPSTTLYERQPDTAFTQYGGSLHAQYSLAPSRQLIFHYERSQQDGGKRADQLLGGDGNLIAELRNLMVDFSYLKFAAFRAGWLDQIAAQVSFNAQREERINQGGQGNPFATIVHQKERIEVWGAAVQGSRRMGRQEILAGAESYWEHMRAPAYNRDPRTGVISLTRPRVPDRARYQTYGAFVQDVWELFGDRLRLTGGLRFGGASYRSRARYAPVVNGRPLWPDDSMSDNALTGRAGVVWTPAEPLRFYFHYSRGFRTPSMTDLGTVGLQGNGFYEAAVADLAGRGAFVGTRADDQAVNSGRRVAPVVSELSDNFDGGVQFRAGGLRTNFTVFRLDLAQTIVSQTLILPPGAVGQPLGDQIISRQLPSGAVFVPLSVSPVQVRANFTGVRSYGVEHTLDWRISSRWWFAENVTWIRAEDEVSGDPPDIEGGTPPLTGNLRLRYAPARRFWVEGYGTLAWRQERLSSLALADRRTGASRSRSAIANFFNRGAVARGLVSAGVLLPTGETLAQVQNRVLGARESAPLYPVLAGYGVWGIRGGIQLNEETDVFADFSNLFDKNYRGIGWGVDGPGRGVTVRLRRRW
jgi:outer membrane receptor protein involved in Fe transport